MTAADTAALTARARDFTRLMKGAPGSALVRDLADALERAESEIRADQMRRDADLLDEIATDTRFDVSHYTLRAAADRLRSGQPAGGVR